MRQQGSHQPAISRSLESRLEFKPNYSATLLNEYYHHEFNRGMQSISRLTQLHDKIVVRDKELEIDERDELTWEEYNESRKLKSEVKKLKKQRKETRDSQTRRQQYHSLQKGGVKSLRTELIEQTKYSKKKASPTKLSKVVQEPAEVPQPPQTHRTEAAVKQQKAPELSRPRGDSMMSELPPSSSVQNRSRSPSRASEMSVIKLRKIESTNDNKSEVMSLTGKAVVSEIPMDMRSEIDEKQRSIYSLALKSHMSKNTRRTSKSKEQVEKKNFKKAFLEKKYNTSNLSQLHHKIEKENQLQVRELRRLGMANFSAVMHQRREEKQAALDVIHERHVFEAMKDTLYREISQPNNNPLIQETNVSAFLPRRPMKPNYQDLTSSIENIEIQEYQIEESMISEEREIQTEESMAQYQAIYEAFDVRNHRRQHSKQDSSHQREDSSSFSRYYTNEEHKLRKSNKAIEEHSQEDDSRMEEPDPDQPSQQELDRQAQEENERKQRIIGDQLFGFMNNIEFRGNPYFEGSLRRLIGLANQVKYDFRDNVSMTKERVLLLVRELLAQRDTVKKEHQRLSSHINRQKQQLTGHLDSKGEPLTKQYKHSEQVSRVISQSSIMGMPQSAGESLDKSLLINKVVIKKLVQKCCQLFQHNVHRSLQQSHVA